MTRTRTRVVPQEVATPEPPKSTKEVIPRKEYRARCAAWRLSYISDLSRIERMLVGYGITSVECDLAREDLNRNWDAHKKFIETYTFKGAEFHEL